MIKGFDIILYVVAGMAVIYLALVGSDMFQQAKQDEVQSKQEIQELKQKVNSSRRDADKQWVTNQEQQELIQMQQQSLQFQGELLKEVESISRGLLLLESIRE